MKLKKENIYSICKLIYIIMLVLSFYMNYKENNMEAFYMGFVAVFTPFIIPIIFKIIHWNITTEVKIANIIFIFFASLIGSCYDGYSISFFDKILHFTSGIFGTLLALLLYTFIKKQKYTEETKDHFILLIFINAVNMSIALLWEYYEYFMLIFFNNDCINHYTSGIHDSITDTMCAFVAGILCSILVYRYYHFNKSCFFIRLYESIVNQNDFIQGEQDGKLKRK